MSGQHRNTVQLLVFQVHQRSLLEPLARIQQGNIFRQGTPPERWIQKHDVECLRGRAQISRGAHFYHSGLAAAAQADQLLLQGARCGDRLLDEHQLLRATGKGLESKRTGAGKQIEAASAGVRVNAVCPGWIKTGMDTADQGAGAYSDADIVDRVPLARFARPEDVAEAIAFLLDANRSGFVNGISLPVDGGWLADASWNSLRLHTRV